MNGSRLRLVPALVFSLPMLLLATPSGRVEAAPHLVRKLPNKMTVVIRENRTRPMVAVQAWILSGRRDEARNERGVATVMSKSMLIATKRRDSGVIESDLLSNAATFVSDVGYAHMSFGVTLPARSLDAGLDILADIVTRPRFGDGDVTQGIAGSRLESRGLLSQAEAPSLNAVRQALHPESPLGSPIVIPDGNLAAVTAASVRSFYKKHVVAENVMIVIVGNVDPEETARRVETAFAEMSQGRAPSHPKASQKSMNGLKVLAEAAPGVTTGSAVTAAFRGPAWGTADAVALDVLMAVLADGPMSRLRLRLAAGGEFLGVTSADVFDPDGGTIALSLRFRPEQAKEAENALIAEIAQARSAPIRPEELDSAIRHVLTRDLVAASELTGLARATGLGFLMGKPGLDEVYFDRVKAVRSEDLLAVANKYFDWKQGAVVETAPSALADSFRMWNDFEKRIREHVQMHQAAYGSTPAGPMSKDAERAAHIDGPLKSISPTPVDLGRGRVDRVAASPGADLGDLRVLVSEDRSVPLVTIGVYLGGGVRYENEENNGVTALLRETLMSGTDAKAGDLTYRESLGALGSFVQYHDRDLWGVSLTVPSEDWKYALDRVGAAFSQSKLDSTALDAARLVLIDALEGWLRDDESRRAHLIFDTKYEVSGYRFPALGNRKNILTLGNDEVEGWYQKFVVRPNVVVAVFGDVRPAEVGPAVAEAFRGLSSAPFRPGRVAQEAPFENFREKWELGAGPQSNVTLAFNGPNASSPDVPVLYVINSLLTGPKGWFKEYVLAQPSNKDARSYVAHSIDETTIVATVVTDAPMQEETAANLLFRQFKKVAFYPLEGPDAPTLRAAKNHAVNSLLARLSSSPSRVLQYARYDVMGLGTDYPSILAAKADAVVAGDLLRVGMKYFEFDEFKRQPYAIAETRPGGW